VLRLNWVRARAGGDLASVLGWSLHRGFGEQG